MESELRARAKQGAAMLNNGLERMAGTQTDAEPPPDVSQSDITADPDVPVHVAWSKVMGEVQYIAKDRLRADSGGRYNFRGIEDVLNAVGPAVRKHGVLVIPIAIKPEWSTVTTKGGAVMQLCRAEVTFAVIGPRGDQLPHPIVTIGEAFDTGDKSSTKAQSVALRIAYLNALNIPTRQPELDTEYGPQHELAAPAPPTTDEYYARITNPRVTLTRLQQIRRELNDHPDQRDEIVTEPDGTQTKLIDVLTRVGKAKQAAQEGPK